MSRKSMNVCFKCQWLYFPTEISHQKNQFYLLFQFLNKCVHHQPNCGICDNRQHDAISPRSVVVHWAVEERRQHSTSSVAGTVPNVFAICPPALWVAKGTERQRTKTVSHFLNCPYPTSKLSVSRHRRRRCQRSISLWCFAWLV